MLSQISIARKSTICGKNKIKLLTADQIHDFLEAFIPAMTHTHTHIYIYIQTVLPQDRQTLKG